MIVVSFTTVTLVASAPPNVTVAPDWKPVPAIVTGEPPPTLPLLGETLETAGAGAKLIMYRPTLVAAMRRRPGVIASP